MIRGSLAPVFLTLLLVILVHTTSFSKLQIQKVQKVVNLNGAYATETNKITFVAEEDQVAHLSYLIPLEYDSKVSKIWFTKTQKDRAQLHYSKNIYSHEGVTYAEYKVSLPHNFNIGDDGDIHAHIVYLYRFVNLPASIGLTQDQKVQYEDVKFVVSPYEIKEHQTVYKFQRLFDAEEDGQRRGGDVSFSKYNVAPFTVIKHRVFGINNNPLVQFTHVEKVIEISHWGNVGIVQNYKIANKGPSLKGEFSRVTFGARGGEVKNAWRGAEFDLPYEIWGLYYLDEVGNISTSKAYRNQNSRSVRVSLNPRFGLLGGWKSNWQLGYNFNTEGHLFHTGNKFELKNIKLEYAAQKILAEEYTIKIILPYGSENVKIKIGGHNYDTSSLEYTTSEGYLDFNGRPTYYIPNYQGILSNKNIEVEYDFNQSIVYEKLFILTIIVLAILGFAIFFKRFKLEAFEEVKNE